MTQFIKLELLSRQPDMTKILLATEFLHIQFLEQKEIWGKFFWVNFYTSVNVQNSIGRKMVEGLVEGNCFGGQLLVKIEKEKTTNPKPVSKIAMLIDRSQEKGLKEHIARKSKFIGDLIQKHNIIPGSKETEQFESQPKVIKHKLQLYFEL